MIVIGITGLNAAGKGTFAEFLQNNDFEYNSLSDILRDILRERKVEINRKNLVEVGNEMRQTHGAGALGLKMVEKFKNSKEEKFIVDSIRNPSEVTELRKLDNFTLVAIDAEPKTRFDRAMARGRDENATTFEEFIAQENKEMSDDEKSQQLHKCIELADVVIENNDSIENLGEKTKEFLANL